MKGYKRTFGGPVSRRALDRQVEPPLRTPRNSKSSDTSKWYELKAWSLATSAES